MLPEPRAVVFDLDDTLYPYRWFVRSGFREVARDLQWSHGVDAHAVFRHLLLASRNGGRGRELQSAVAACGLSPVLVPRLVGVLRGHDPALRLPHTTRRLLARLRGAGWRLGVLTNGDPDIQRRKVRALGLERYVDAVVYAAACGAPAGARFEDPPAGARLEDPPAGKPDPRAFEAIAEALDVPVRHVVVVGDDEAADVNGAAAAGMVAVHCAVWRPEAVPAGAGPIARRASQIPGLARVLLEEALSHHAA